MLISLTFTILINSCSDNPNGPDINLNFANYVLQEVNYIRTDPEGYAEENLKDLYETNSDNGAYLDIKSYNSVIPLKLNDLLNQAATNYAKYLGENNTFGHYENMTPQLRCDAEGYKFYSGENLAAASYKNYNADIYSQEAARLFIRQLVVDMGVQSLGHRKNIMSANHKVMGIGFYHTEDTDLKNYFVQDFGSME